MSSSRGPHRQLILLMSVSLDGFVARTDGLSTGSPERAPGGSTTAIGATVGLELISSTAYADGCITQVLRPA